MSYSEIQRRLRADVIYYSSSLTNQSISSGSTIPWNTAADLIGSAASSYSVSSGVITLPSGSWYLLKAQLQVRFSSQTGHIKYIWRDSSNVDLGRRGTMIMQEQPQTFGGDELAVALVDATSASVDVKLVVQSIASVSEFNSTTETTWAGGSRAEIWKI